MKNLDFYTRNFFSKLPRKWSFGIDSVNNNFNKKMHQKHPRIMLRLYYIASVIEGFRLYFTGDYKLARKNRKVILQGHVRHFREKVVSYDVLRMLHLRSFIYNNRVIDEWMNECSDKLMKEILHHESKYNMPIMLAPMHIYSDEFAILIASRAIGKQLDVISHIGNEEWEREWGKGAQNLEPSQDTTDKVGKLNLINVFSKNSKESGMDLLSSIKRLKSGQSNIAIFIDATPEYTTRFGKIQKLKAVEVFKKKSLMHNGPFDIPIRANCLTLPYYIHYSKGKITIEILSPIQPGEIETGIINTIEDVLSKKYLQWLFWHNTSFFLFNG